VKDDFCSKFLVPEFGELFFVDPQQNKMGMYYGVVNMTRKHGVSSDWKGDSPCVDVLKKMAYTYGWHQRDELFSGCYCDVQQFSWKYEDREERKAPEEANNWLNMPEFSKIKGGTDIGYASPENLVSGVCEDRQCKMYDCYEADKFPEWDEKMVDIRTGYIFNPQIIKDSKKCFAGDFYSNQLDRVRNYEEESNIKSKIKTYVANAI
jgi:hypothetical protein